MVQPITWHTVNGPSLAEASRPMEAASRSFNDAFGGLDNILKQRQAIETGNWDQTKVNNTNALLGAVQEPRTPEEFAAKEAQLRQMVAGFGAQVDPIAARAALDGRMATLQQRAVAGMDYQNKVTDNREAPIRDSIAALTSQGRFPEAQALLEANTLRNEAALYDANRQGQRRVTTEGQADTKFGFDQATEAQKVLERPLALDKLNSDLLTAAAQRKLLSAQAEAQKATNTSQSASVKAASTALKQQDAAYDQIMKNNLFGGGSLEPGRNLAEVTKYVTSSIADKDEAEKLNRAIAKLSSQKFDVGNGVKVGVPISLLQEALHLSKDTSWFFGSNRVENFEKAIKARMADPDVAEQALVANQIEANRLNRASILSPGSAAPQPGVGGDGLEKKRLEILE